jgi:two-component system sensor histidine kinase BaeS
LYRVEESRNRATGGAGLGLAICKNIVDAHNGQIEADNSPLGGIRIKIQLPLHEGR